MAYIKEIILPNGSAYDIKGEVEQSAVTDANWHNVLLSENYNASSDATVTDGVGGTNEVSGISAQPSTGTIRANVFDVKDKCNIQYDATTESIKFVFT